jgi:hypothetical protein
MFPDMYTTMLMNLAAISGFSLIIGIIAFILVSNLEEKVEELERKLNDK